MWELFRIFVHKHKIRYMKAITLLRDSITIDGKKFYHYSLGGKWNSTQFVVIEGIHYYNSSDLTLVELPSLAPSELNSEFED
jgi:hypothetical protein